MKTIINSTSFNKTSDTWRTEQFTFIKAQNSESTPEDKHTSTTTVYNTYWLIIDQKWDLLRGKEVRGGGSEPAELSRPRRRTTDGAMTEELKILLQLWTLKETVSNSPQIPLCGPGSGGRSLCTSPSVCCFVVRSLTWNLQEVIGCQSCFWFSSSSFTSSISPVSHFTL